MKILLATYWPVPHVGGVWNYMVQLKKNLEKLGHEVDLLGYGGDQSYIHLVNKDRKLFTNELLPLLEAKITPENYPEIFANPLIKYTEFQRYMYELASAYFDLSQYDIIHSQDVISAVSINRVKPGSVPLIATLHGSVAHEIYHQLTTIHKSETSFMAKEYYTKIENLGATVPHTTIVANNWLKNILIDEFNVPINQIQVQHYGYDIKSFLEKMKISTNSIRKPEDKKIIMYTGRLTDLKGVQHLLSALNILKKDRDDWACWIIGDGDKLADLREQSKTMNLDEDVFFFGERGDIPYLLTLADIYVLPSLLENQPLSVIEAQLAGKAIIVSEIGGLPEMVENNITGITIPPSNPEILFESIRMLLDSETLRNRLGSNAKKWGVSHWSQKKAVKNLIKIYSNAISDYRKEKEDEASFTSS